MTKRGGRGGCDELIADAAPAIGGVGLRVGAGDVASPQLDALSEPAGSASMIGHPVVFGAGLVSRCDIRFLP